MEGFAPEDVLLVTEGLVRNVLARLGKRSRILPDGRRPIGKLRGRFYDRSELLSDPIDIDVVSPADVSSSFSSRFSPYFDPPPPRAPTPPLTAVSS